MMNGQPDALPTAVYWLRDVLLGSVASSVAVIAVAGVGLGMLTGRIDWRRGARVVTGCFVLFGAPSIAAGLMTLAGSRAEPAPPADPVLPAPPAPRPVVAAPPSDYDPYAGASVPVRR